LQAPYPKIFSAPEIPSWQTWEMEDSPFDRELVRQTMRRLKVTQKELADALKLNQSAISNILNGTRQVKVHEGSFIYRRLGIRSEPSINLVPIIGLTSAGNWREAIQNTGGAMPVPRDVAGERAFAVEIRGDSMDLLIRDGAYVVVDPDQTHLIDEKIYLIENSDHEAQIKMYRTKPARFSPCSSNETHKEMDLSEAHIRVIGRVVWQGAPL
jgi:repressor LexA